MLPGSSKISKCLLWIWGIGFLLQVACASIFAEQTFKTISAEIEAPLEACPTIAGMYEFIGTPLPGVPTHWQDWGLYFDYFLQDRTMFFGYGMDEEEAIKTVTAEVEIAQDQTMQVQLQGQFGQKIIILPERSDDQLGCVEGEILLTRIRDFYTEGSRGKSVYRHTFVKNVDGSLDITLQELSYHNFLIALFIPWAHEELYGARFAPKR